MKVSTNSPLSGLPAAAFDCVGGGDDHPRHAAIGLLLGIDGVFWGVAYCGDEKHMAAALAEQAGYDAPPPPPSVDENDRQDGA